MALDLTCGMMTLKIRLMMPKPEGMITIAHLVTTIVIVTLLEPLDLQHVPFTLTRKNTNSRSHSFYSRSSLFIKGQNRAKLPG